MFQIRVNENEVITTQGYAEGHQSTSISIASSFDKAIEIAQTKWDKKKREGYISPEKETKQERPKIYPMLALNYKERGHDVVFPCSVQPKLDGLRSLFYNDSLYSRTGKEFVFLDHIKEEARKNIPEGMILDGEIYSDTLTFEEISGFVRKKKLIKSDFPKLLQINWVIYDFVSSKDFSSRYKDLQKLFSEKSFKYLKLLPRETCNTKEDIPRFLKKYEEQGYEGLIIRNNKGLYKTKSRSKDLQKLKNFLDEEFEITGFTDGDNGEKGLVIWVCKTKCNKTFTVRPRGTHIERSQLFKEGKLTADLIPTKMRISLLIFILKK